AHALDLGLSAELSFDADVAGDAGHLIGESVQLIDHRVDGVLELEDLAARVDHDLLLQIALGDCARHQGDVAYLPGEVLRHRVDLVARVTSGPAHAADVGLSAELALDADVAGEARHLGGEGAELVDHRVDGVLELEDLAARVDHDLPAQVAVGD